MSIYSELLRLALAHDHDHDEAGVGPLVARLVERRSQLEQSRTELAPSASRAAEWTADLIAHDVALVELCERLGIIQTLTDAAAPPTERDRLLAVVAARVNLEELGPFSGELRS